MKPTLTGALRRLPERVRLEAAIERMSPNDRAVLALLLTDGLSVAEAAEALELTAQDVRRRFGELRRELRPLVALRPARKAA